MSKQKTPKYFYFWFDKYNMIYDFEEFYKLQLMEWERQELEKKTYIDYKGEPLTEQEDKRLEEIETNEDLKEFKEEYENIIYSMGLVMANIMFKCLGGKQIYAIDKKEQRPFKRLWKALSGDISESLEKYKMAIEYGRKGWEQKQKRGRD